MLSKKVTKASLYAVALVCAAQVYFKVRSCRSHQHLNSALRYSWHIQL